MRYVRLCHVEFHCAGLYFDGLRNRTDLKRHVLPHDLAALQQNSGVDRGLEPGVIHVHRIRAQHQRRGGVRAGIVCRQDRLDTRAFIANSHGRPGNAGSTGVADNAGDDGAI